MISGVSWRSESVPLLKISRSGGFDASEESHRTRHPGEGRDPDHPEIVFLLLQE
jgi:hypothetical protein